MAVHINGKSYPGNNVSMINGKVFIDGKEIQGEETEKEILFKIQGNLGSLKIESGSVEVSGDVGTLEITSGNVKISGDVKGSVDLTSGNIKIQGKIEGNASVACGNIKKGIF